MNDEDITNQIKKLNEKIEALEKQLAENKKGDDHRHKEIKELQKQQHQDDMK
jgi:peptidoglycan hydrolase CwlO-like protein